MDPLGIVRDFETYFDVVPAYSDALRDEVFRIRYAVYAEELGWEDVDAFPEKREIDEYDARSVHCLLKHNPTDQYIGCVRLVLGDALAPEAPLPIEAAYERTFTPEGLHGNPGAERGTYGEISRIAVVSAFRHRPGEQNIPETTIEGDKRFDPRGRRRFPHIALGLYLAAAAVSMSRDLRVVLAMMEPKLARRLRIFGIVFEQVADPIEHHGLRAAYRMTEKSFATSLSPPLQELFELIRKKIDTHGS